MVCTLSFSKKNWHIIGPSVISYCHKVFKDRSIPASLNNTYICLIPRIPNAFNLKNFIPIGLCNTIYKIITKIIVNRIKPFLGTIISPYQASFMKNYRASDNVIIIKEHINSINKKKGKTSNMIIKIDLEKAFDRIEWSFIYQTLHHLKFSLKNTRLIMSCITTSQISILVNGHKTNYFSPNRGIRQGDPISPIFSSFSWRCYPII